MRRSECELVSSGSSYGSVCFVLFSAQGDRKGPALVYRLTCARCVLFRECHHHHHTQSVIALCQCPVTMATRRSNAPSRVTVSAS